MAASGGPSTRALARIFFTLTAFAVGLYVLFLVRDVVGLVLIAVFLAIALGPAVDFFNCRGISRGLSILLTYILILLGTVGIGALVVPPIVKQINSFVEHVPTYIRDAQKNKTIRSYDKRYKIGDKLEDAANKLPAKLGDAAGALQAVTVGVFATIIQLVTVLTLTFFLLLDGGGLFGWFAALFGREREQQIRVISRDVYRSVAGYVAGNLIISLIAGTFVFITLTALGVRFAVPLAVFFAFVDLIPIIGSAIGAIGVGLITLFDNFPTATIIWVIASLIYQQVENNLIQPIVYRKTVDVAPLFVIVSILIGSKLLGVLGALVAIPIAAAVQIVVRDLWQRRGKVDTELVVVGEEGPPPVEPDDDGGPGGAPSVIVP